MLATALLNIVLLLVDDANRSPTELRPVDVRYRSATERLCPKASQALRDSDRAKTVVSYEESVGRHLIIIDLTAAANASIRCASTRKGLDRAYLYVFANDALSGFEAYGSDADIQHARSRRKEVLTKARKDAKDDPELLRLIEAQLDTLL